MELAKLYVAMALDARQYTQGIRAEIDQAANYGRQLGSNLMRYAQIAVMAAAVAFAAAVGGVIAGSVAQAASLEQVMSGAQAVMGATTAEAAALKETVMDLSIDPRLKVSATEAGAAVEMLGRNGLKAHQIIDGAAEAVVLLSNATGGDFAKSANIATDAMALWGIEAQNMGVAVDGIVSVVTNSKFTMNDYALALAQGGGVAAAVGVEFADFNATIAAISPYFKSGSDAGTSFKVFLQQLVPTSNKAKDAMAELGLITEDGSNAFFTAQGELRSMAEVAGILQRATSNLTEEQRSYYLGIIFGTDAMRAAASMAGYTTDEFAKLQTEMANTSAAEQAAIRIDNLKGDMEIFKSVVQGLSIQIGDAFIPVLRLLVQKGTQLATVYGPRVVSAFSAFANVLQRIIPIVFQILSRIKTVFNTSLTPLVATAKSWGSNIAKSFAVGIMAVVSFVVQVLRKLRQVITYWLRPGSPPRLLQDIDQWGTQTANEYFKGWLKADFDLLQDFGSSVRLALQSSLEGASLDLAVIDFQLGFSQAQNEIKEFGKVSRGTFETLMSQAAQAGKGVQTLTRQYVELAEANYEVARAQDALNAITSRYDSIVEPLRANLATWGSEAGTLYLEGWQDADFKMLEEFGGDVRNALSGFLEGATLDVATLGLQAGFAEAIDEVVQFGKVSQGTFESVLQDARLVGDEVADLALAYLDLAEANYAVARAQDALNAITGRYDSIVEPLLTNLSEWGSQAATYYLEGWFDADFQVLEEFTSAIRGVLDDFLEGVSLDAATLGLQAGFADAINEIAEFGEVSQDTFDSVIDDARLIGNEVADLAQGYLELADANHEVARAQQELNEITSHYQDLISPLDEELKAIRDQKGLKELDRRFLRIQDELANPELIGLDREIAMLELAALERERGIKALEIQMAKESKGAADNLSAAEKNVSLAEERINQAQAALNFQNLINDAVRTQAEYQLQAAQQVAQQKQEEVAQAKMALDFQNMINDAVRSQAEYQLEAAQQVVQQKQEEIEQTKAILEFNNSISDALKAQAEEAAKQAEELAEAAMSAGDLSNALADSGLDSDALSSSLADIESISADIPTNLEDIGPILDDANAQAIELNENLGFEAKLGDGFQLPELPDSDSIWNDSKLADSLQLPETDSLEELWQMIEQVQEGINSFDNALSKGDTPFESAIYGLGVALQFSDGQIQPFIDKTNALQERLVSLSERVDTATKIFSNLQNQGISPVKAAIYGLSALFQVSSNYTVFLIDKINFLEESFASLQQRINSGIETFKNLRASGVSPAEAAIGGLNVTLGNLRSMPAVIVGIAASFGTFSILNNIVGLVARLTAKLTGLGFAIKIAKAWLWPFNYAWSGLSPILLSVWRNSRVLQGGFAVLSAAVQAFGNLVRSSLGAAFRFLLRLMAPVGKFLGSLAGLFKPLLKYIAPVAKWLGGPLARGFSMVSRLIMPLVSLLGGPVTAALLAVAVIIGLLAAAWVNDWGNIRETLATAWAYIQAVFSAAMETLGPIFDRLREAILNVMANLSESVGPLMESMSKLWVALEPIFSGLLMIVGGALTGLVGIVIGIVGGLVSAIETFMGMVQSVVMGVITFVTGVANTLTGIFNLIVGVLTGDTDKIQEAWVLMGTGIQQILSGLGQAIWGFWAGLWNTVASFVGGFVQGVIDFFWSLHNELVGNSIVPDMINAIYDWFVKLKDMVGSVVGPFVEMVSGFFQGLAESLGLSWDGMIQSVKGFGEFLGQVALAIYGWVTNTLIPAVGGFYTNWTTIWWPAIQGALSTAWYDHILPALQGLWTWFTETLIPAVGGFYTNWTTIWWPAIQEALSTAWYDHILPALQDLWTWFTDTLIPAVGDFYTSWTTIWWPQIQAALSSAWIIIYPIFESLWFWIKDNLVSAAEDFYTNWTTIWWPQIQEAVSEAWEVIEEIWEIIQGWYENIIGPIQACRAAWVESWNEMKKAIDKAWESIDKLFTAAKKFFEWLKTKIFKFNIDLPSLPSWATPGSPIPLHTRWKEFHQFLRSAKFKPQMKFGVADLPASTQMKVDLAFNKNKTGNLAAISDLSVMDEVIASSSVESFEDNSQNNYHFHSMNDGRTAAAEIERIRKNRINTRARG